jgi:hypothetical protein
MYKNRKIESSTVFIPKGHHSASSRESQRELFVLSILGGVSEETQLKVNKIEIFLGFDFEICNISLLFMSKY